MAFNFPDTPTVGQAFGNYLWDGEKWTLPSGGSGVPSAPFYAMAGHNLFINGGMEVSQELGTHGQSLTSASLRYAADMAISGYKNAAASVFMGRADAAALGGVALPGFNNYHQLFANTAFSGLVNGDYAIHRYLIEGYRIAKLGWGTAGAQPLSYAFMFYSTLGPGVAFIRFNNAFRFLFREFTVAAGWNFVSGTIPGDTSGAWSITNGVGLYVDIFSAGKDAAPASVFNTWGTTNATQTINSSNLLSAAPSQVFVTGLFACAGTQLATQANLPLLMRPYDQELALCQRYFEMVNVPTLQSPAIGTMISPYSFKQTMRAAPTATTITAPSYSNTAGAVINSVTTDMASLQFTSSIASGFLTGWKFQLDARL